LLGLGLGLGVNIFGWIHLASNSGSSCAGSSE
jgi:hypothetical protein